MTARPGAPAPVRLGPREEVAARPFAHPRENSRDLAALCFMRSRVHDLLRSGERERIFVEGGRPHHVRLFDPVALAQDAPRPVVGFRGLRRERVAPEVEAEVFAADARLVEELSRGPDGARPLLSYSTRRLPDGNWLNLVVLRDEAALGAWHASPLHRHAVARLSPRFYTGVRLHRGTLPGGVAQPLRLDATRYFDFEDPWLAERASPEAEHPIPEGPRLESPLPESQGPAHTSSGAEPVA